MTEKKQIEEMRKDVERIHRCFMEDDDYDYLDEYIAAELYTTGYRKQSDGEWIEHPRSYECSVCKVHVEKYAEYYDPTIDYDLNYCPNCGAKMKGGAE